MSNLIVHRGDNDIVLDPSDGVTYCYQIGIGRVIGDNCINLNDSKQLHEIAVTLRQKYTEWVYTFNDLFLDKGLVYRSISLFFLTDLSNKRNELFDTYGAIVNLTLLRTKLADKEINTIRLIGLDSAFEQSIRSIFPDAIICSERTKRRRVQLVRRIAADMKYFMEVILVIAMNRLAAVVLRKATPRNSGRLFFSFFPQTFDENCVDTRYGAMVNDEDRYLVTIMADGMHQQISPFRYRKLLRELPRDKFVLIDREFQLSDIWRGIYWLVGCWRLTWAERNTKWLFEQIEVTGFIRQELIWSASRVGRLIVVAGALGRTLKGTSATQLTYLVFEYAFGRMISAIAKSSAPLVERVGFNHGDFSWRFLNYFLAKGEARVDPPYLQYCPIPDKVLAEDELCADIYNYNGYQSVTIMTQVERLKYLDAISPAIDKRFALIVGGLHDGENLLKVLLDTIKSSSKTRFLFKPHPRARKNYLSICQDIPNLQIVHTPIQELLAYVGRIYVTYSGVGVEGWRLGIPVTLVDIPGHASWSKLLDFDEFKR